MKFNVALGITASLLLLSPAIASASSNAELGSPAPALSIAQWIKGQPVDLKAGRGTNIYVVEFWATWCPPCRTTIPNLTVLQRKFKDRGVTVIGISDEDAATVKPFVDSMGTNMNYTVALDDGQKTSAAYMGAFGISTIPHAFIVDQAGKIVWQGNPMAGLEQTLEQILAGKYDMDATRKSMKVQALFQQYVMGAIAGQDVAALKKVGEDLLTTAEKMPGVLHQFASVVLNEQRIVTRQVDLALRAAKSVYDTTSGKHPVAAATYSKALFENGKAKEALDVATQGLAHAQDDNARSLLKAAIEKAEKSAKASK